MIWQLFQAFFQIGLISFGGGYAMIPLVRHEVLARGWLPDGRLSELFALAGMAPGPIATNSATLIGYETAGIPGAVMATGGMILPSLLFIIVTAALFFRWEKKRWVKHTFYGLKPVITGMILYAAVHFIVPDLSPEGISWHTSGILIIVLICLYALLKYRVHPLAVLALSAVLGIAFFQ